MGNKDRPTPKLLNFSDSMKQEKGSRDGHESCQARVVKHSMGEMICGDVVDFHLGNW